MTASNLNRPVGLVPAGRLCFATGWIGRIALGEELADTWAMTSATMSSGEVHYVDMDRRLPWCSSDEAIVFHHGVAAGSEVWAGWDAALADSYRLIKLDMRGHGGTPVPDGYDWTIDSLVADLGAVVEAAGLERFHLVGESIGGTIALAYAARHPSRVRTLTISNGAHRGAPITNLASWSDIIASGGMSGWSEFMMGMRFFEEAIDVEQSRWYRDQQARPAGDTVLALAASLGATDLTSELSAVTMPTLLLHPDASPFISVSLMAELHELLPNAQLDVIAHARHGLPFSHAAKLSKTLAEFIDLSTSLERLAT